MSDDITTKPTIETVLERINKLGENLIARFDSVESRLTALESEAAATRVDVDAIKSEMSALRVDMQKGFRHVERKVDILGKELLEMRADVRELEERVEQIESKVS